jgi:hypothetical protein
MELKCWCIPSNSGWSNASFEALLCHATGDIEFAVELSGKFWYRAHSNKTPSELVDDFHIKLPSVLIPKSACQELLRQLDSWLQERRAVAVTLASAPDQKMDLEIAERDDLITTVDQPAVTVCYDAPSCRLEVFFVVDETCVEHGKNQLQRILTTFANNL